MASYYYGGAASGKPQIPTFQRPPGVEEHYDLIHSKQLVGVLTLVYCLKKHSKSVTEIQSSIVTTGILGVLVCNLLSIGPRFTD